MKQKTEITKNELDFIIGQGEGQFTEFKERADKSLSKEIVAFVNSTGERILIGISDNFVEVFKNKIIIHNPGGLVQWMRKEDFGKISKTRNSVIASLLARTKYVEKMGTGITRMNNAMIKAGLPQLEFAYDNYTFFVNLFDNSKVSKKTSLKAVGETVGKTVGETVGETAKKIVTLINEDPTITREKLSGLLNISIRGVEWNLKKLKDQGIIARIGSTKGGYWKVNYKDNKK
jgi:ATP-dependent DNA helicase RecG